MSAPMSAHGTLWLSRPGVRPGCGTTSPRAYYLLKLHDDELRHLASLDEQKHLAAALCLLDSRHKLLDIRHVLLVHGEDQIAGLNSFPGRGATGRYARNDHSLPKLVPELVGQVLRQILNLQAERLLRFLGRRLV